MLTATIKTVWRFLNKLKIELPYDPAIPLLDIYPKEMKSGSQRNIHTITFMAAFFTIMKIWKQPKYLSMDEWIKKMQCIYGLPLNNISLNCVGPLIYSSF